MGLRTARLKHASTNFFYWVESPDWSTGSGIGDAACKVVRALPFSLHELQKRAFYDTSQLIAVNGESVVVARDKNHVDKFMFRYPRSKTLEAFRQLATQETSLVTHFLAGIALPTTVSIKPAQIFRNPNKVVPAVVQTQQRVNLVSNPAFSLETLQQQPGSSISSETVRDLEGLLIGAQGLMKDSSLYPDIGENSGNLRVSRDSGRLTLIDVMPVYTSGSRLIGDHSPGHVDGIKTTLANYESFVGNYGA